MGIGNRPDAQHKGMTMLRRGMSQREALRILATNGFVVEHRRGTGELMIRYPDSKPIVMRKRKDLPSEVVHLVRRILASKVTTPAVLT